MSKSEMTEKENGERKRRKRLTPQEEHHRNSYQVRVTVVSRDTGKVKMLRFRMDEYKSRRSRMTENHRSRRTGNRFVSFPMLTQSLVVRDKASAKIELNSGLTEVLESTALAHEAGNLESHKYF